MTHIAARFFAILYLLSSILVLASIVVVTPGCNVLGLVAAKTTGGPPIPAAYVPPKIPMVVMAENWRNPAGSSIDTDQLVRYVRDDLEAHGVAPQIDPVAVLDLRSKSPAAYRAMSIAQVGQQVGAKQVLYINVVSSSLDSPQGAEFVRGNCNARVKIVDVATAQVTWPADAADGYPITVQTPVLQGGPNVDDTTLRQSLQRMVAKRVGQLFYKRAADATDE